MVYTVNHYSDKDLLYILIELTTLILSPVLISEMSCVPTTSVFSWNLGC